MAEGSGMFCRHRRRYGAACSMEQSPRTQRAGAKAGLAQVELMGRLQPMSAQDSEALRSLAANEPDNLEAQLAVADLDIAGGHVEDALNRLVAFIGRNFGPERETARVRLLELFDVVGAADERVAKARQALARVLF